jgi:hypothetical protein
VDEADIKATGAVNMSQLVNTIPAIFTSGAAPQGEPTFYNSNTSGILGFNGFVSTPIGRIVSVGLRADF